MGKNSKLKRDNKKKKTQKKVVNNSNNSLAFNMPDSFEDMMRMQGEIDKLFDPSSLTTPHIIDDNIIEFSRKISEYEPVFLDIEPEDWCRQSCCDLNVYEYIQANGGKILCGYKIWYNEPNYIEGERHAVWCSDDGSLKDITFNSDGEKSILFIADNLENQSLLDANEPRIRWGKTEKVKGIIAFQEQAESMMPVQTMSDADAWKTAITYKDWCDGKRMSNQCLKING